MLNFCFLFSNSADEGSVCIITFLRLRGWHFPISDLVQESTVIYPPPAMGNVAKNFHCSFLYYIGFRVFNADYSICTVDYLLSVSSI